MVRHQGKGDENLLRRAGTTLFVLLFAAFANIVGAEQASAEPVECPAGSVWNPQAVTCVLKVTPPPPATTDLSTPRESGSHSVNSKSPKRCVSSFSGKEGPQKGHIHPWNVASDLVGNSCQNKNRVPTVQGPIVGALPVREHLQRGRHDVPGIGISIWILLMSIGRC